MIKVGLFVRLQSKPGKEAAVSELLEKALAMANEEANTPVWFALRLAPSTFAIFDAFNDDAARQAHLGGAIAVALLTQAPHLLAEEPRIERLDVLGAKLPS